MAKPVSCMGAAPSVAVAVAVANSADVELRSCDALWLEIPSGSTLTTITFFGRADGGDWLPIRSSGSTPVSLTVAGGGLYLAPSSIGQWGGQLRIVGDVAETIRCFGSRATG